MGWNTARVTLLPPGWRHVATQAPRGRTETGPVWIVRAVRDAGAGGKPVFAAGVVALLEESGFRAVERSPRRVTLTKDDMEALAANEGDELTDLELTFTLGREAPLRRDRWRELVQALCATFDLSLSDLDRPTGKAPAGDFFRVLAAAPAWQDFAQAHGWAAPDAAPRPPAPLTWEGAEEKSA
jgi:hypothetical protein